MKFSNKFIKGILITGLLPFLFGCDKNEAVFAYAKGIGIQYVDKEGNTLYFDKDGSISYFDKVDYYSQNLSEEDRRVLLSSERYEGNGKYIIRVI